MAVSVQHGGFHHHLAPALGERALQLAIGEQRVHDGSRVVHPHDALRCHRSGVAIDAHRHDESARAPDLALGAEEARRLEPGLGAGRESRAAVGELGHARPADHAPGRADDAEAPIDRHHVVRPGLQEARGEPPRLFSHVARRERQRRPAESDAPAPERADALRRAERVAVADGHRLRRDTELVGDDLGERGLVPLAMRARARDGEHGTGLLDSDQPTLPPEAGRLDVDGDADADDLTPFAPHRLRAPETCVVGRGQRAVQEPGVVTGVIDLPRRGLEGKAIAGNQVAPPQLDRIEPERPRGLVHEALDQERGLRTPRAAVGADRRGRREDADRFDVDVLDEIGPRQAPAVVLGRAADSDGEA